MFAMGSEPVLSMRQQAILTRESGLDHCPARLSCADKLEAPASGKGSAEPGLARVVAWHLDRI
jgi:hypothetical protein